MKIEDHIDWARKVALKFRRKHNIFIEYEELVSLAMLGLMKAAKNYDRDKGKFRSFAWGRVIGEIKDWLDRRTTSKRSAFTVSLEDLLADQIPSVNGTEEKVANKELVEKLLEFPTARQVQLIRLHYLEGQSVENIAKVEKVTESNIWLLMWRGMNTMKKAVKLDYV